MPSIKRSVVFTALTAVAILMVFCSVVFRPSMRWNELGEIIDISSVDIISYKKSILGDRSEKWIVKIDPESSNGIIVNCNHFGENLATDRNTKGWFDEMQGLVSRGIANEFETPFFVAGIFFYSSERRGPFVDVVISKSRGYVYFHLWDI